VTGGSHDTVQVRRADLADAAALAAVLAAAFDEDPVSAWLFPNAADRRQRQPGFLRLFVNHTIPWGEVHTTVDLDAAALWLPVDPDTGILSHGESAGAFQEVLGPNYRRYIVLDRQAQAVHPTTRPHAFLPFIGVHPTRQGHGIGSALLTHKLTELDDAGIPAYLEASSFRSRALYERLGFRRLPERISLPFGPNLWPMWRAPHKP
jgi:ribosomal protein S18 acetylase RimI-like enzyme